MKIKLLTATVVALSFTNGVYAQTGSGLYMSIKAGVSDINLDKNNASYEVVGTYTSNPDVTAVGTETGNVKLKDSNNTQAISAFALGFDFSTMSSINARAELEYTYKGKSSFSPDITSGSEADTYKVIDNSDGSTRFEESDSYSYGSEPGYLTNEIRSHQLMLNGYYDFKNTSKFTPYLGAGIGLTHLKNKVKVTDDSEDLGTKSDTNFTWSVGAGVGYALTPNLSMDIGYRYVDAGNIEFSTSSPYTDGDYTETGSIKTKADLSSHDYTIGLRYSF